MKTLAEKTRGRQFRRIDSRFVRLIPSNEKADNEVTQCPIRGFEPRDGFYLLNPNGVQGFDVSSLFPG